MITLSYLEFYSGIGGWGYALESACRSIGRATSIKLMDPSSHQQKKAMLTNDGDVCQDGTTVQPLNISANLLAAYDHSDLCNTVFTYNHTRDKSVTPNKSFTPRQTPIEKISKKELESHGATVWCMSPPCQPHTRQHSNQHKELDDPRSKSFLHLCNMLETMDEDKLPCLVLLENVVGFENSWEGSVLNPEEIGSQTDSNTCKSSMRGSFAEWRNVLSLRQYKVAHFHLDPTHVGLPNNRPRYYCIAFRTGSLHRILEGKRHKNVQSGHLFNETVFDNMFSRENLNEKPTIQTESSLVRIESELSSSANVPTLIPPIKNFLDAELMSHEPADEKLTQTLKSLQIPLKVQTSSSAWCFDVVTPHHTCSSCFTHSYGKYIRGTGSILYYGPLRMDKDNADKGIPSIEKFQLASPEDRTFDETWSNDINWEYMRYLSGAEIARLMGFPVSAPAVGGTSPTKAAKSDQEARSFSFPEKCTMKQQWKLLGNSLNVQVAAKVAEIGIRAILIDVIAYHK